MAPIPLLLTCLLAASNSTASYPSPTFNTTPGHGSSTNVGACNSTLSNNPYRTGDCGGLEQRGPELEKRKNGETRFMIAYTIAKVLIKEVPRAMVKGDSRREKPGLVCPRCI